MKSRGWMRMSDLRGKVAVVTGAASGVGQGIAVSLAGAGAKVVVVYHRRPPEDTMLAISQAGGEAIAISADTQVRESVRALFAQTAEAFGTTIDILINNAAMQPNLWLLEYPPEDYQMVMDVNLMGYFRCIQEVLPYMRCAPFGRIINVASIHAKRPTSFDPVYGMSKGAIKMLTREAALALGQYGITVNALNLGAVKVGPKSGSFGWKKVTRSWASDKQPQSGFLSGRLGLPSDAGNLAIFLCLPQAQYITGSSLRMDGGTMML